MRRGGGCVARRAPARILTSCRECVRLAGPRNRARYWRHDERTRIHRPPHRAPPPRALRDGRLPRSPRGLRPEAALAGPRPLEPLLLPPSRARPLEGRRPLPEDRRGARPAVPRDRGALRDGRLCITSIVHLAKVLTPMEVAAAILPAEAAPRREVVTAVRIAAPEGVRTPASSAPIERAVQPAELQLAPRPRPPATPPRCLPRFRRPTTSGRDLGRPSAASPWSSAAAPADALGDRGAGIGMAPRRLGRRV